MKLWQLRRHWDALAERDPFFAILTEAERRGNRWPVDDFFSTGITEVALDVDRIRSQVPALGRGSALDFGCGAGRLTRGLAEHFERVTGVDISERMVGIARAHAADPRVNFVHNTRADLSAFADGRFDLVYSRITLQHVAPHYTRAYLAEFARVLAPGGVLSAQIPDRVPSGDPPDRLRFSLWPPTLWMRTVRHVKYHHPGWFPGTPKMQMYAIPQAEVARLLGAAGLRVVSVEERPHADVRNLIYTAVKPTA